MQILPRIAYFRGKKRTTMLGLDGSIVEKNLFRFLLVATVVPLWLHQYYLTGDGPCHVYNANLVFDLWKDQHYEFYNAYLFLHRILLPNWFAHFWLGALMEVFPPYSAEKILLTAYALLLPLSVRWAVQQINPRASYLAFLSFPFVYNHVFQMGFYNFSFSVVGCFLLIGYYLRWRAALTPGRQLGLAIGWLLLYFCHPVGLAYAGAALGFFIVVEKGVSGRQAGWTLNQFVLAWGEALGSLLLSALPALALFANFLYYHPSPPAPNPDTFFKLQQEFFELTALIALTWREKPLAVAMAVVFGLLLGYIIYQRGRERRWSAYDGFLLMFFLAVLIYFKAPGGLAGAGILSVRLQFFPYLLLLLWLATVTPPPALRGAVMVLGVGFTLAFIGVRLPTYQRQAEALSEILSVDPLIEPTKTLLPLSFSFNGLSTNGQPIADAIWLFVHPFDYLGARKPLIIFPNYEASTWNFPIVWRWQREGFSQIGNVEAIPPEANFLDYPQRTGGAVDYVLTWCQDQSPWPDHPATKNINAQLAAGYDLIYTSTSGRVKLYRRKN